MGHKNRNRDRNHNHEFSKKPMEDKDIRDVADEIEEVIPEEIEKEENPDSQDESQEKSEPDACEDAQKEIEELKAQVEKEKKEYLFLMAEFDNFRKRTLKEKSEIIKNAGENVLKGLLPIMDDFERGLKAAENAPETNAVREGMDLIYNKLKKYLNQNGVKEIDPADDTFDTEKHEAISVVPVPEDDKKGKILDTVEKGYMINDKVLRHAKVVVGQ